MDRALRHLARTRGLLVCIVGGKAGALAFAATLASALWLGVTIPNLALLPGFGGSGANERIAISLQSALLGVDDRVGRSGAGSSLADLRALGLSSARLHVLTVSAAGSNAAGNSPLVVSLRRGVLANTVSHPGDRAVAATHAPPPPPPAPAVATPVRVSPPVRGPHSTTRPATRPAREAAPHKVPPPAPVAADHPVQPEVDPGTTAGDGVAPALAPAPPDGGSSTVDAAA